MRKTDSGKGKQAERQSVFGFFFFETVCFIRSFAITKVEKAEYGKEFIHLS